MKSVIIDGVSYSPSTAKIGVAVTTHNRPDVLNKSLSEWEKYLPSGATFIIVDDGSIPKAPTSDYRFSKSVGIVCAKNKCLELLMHSGCEHLFLFDDDTWPKCEDWYKPYIESPEPHLQYIFQNWSDGRPVGDCKVVDQDDKHVAYSHSRGCMLYFTREVIDRVGGYDPVFGRGMEEHLELSDRIFHAGLATWRYADVKGSSDLIYSSDENMKAHTSLTSSDRIKRDDNNKVRAYRNIVDFKDFVPYYSRPVVLASILTSQKDPQRGTKWQPDAGLAKGLTSSSAYPVVLFSDEKLRNVSSDVEVIQTVITKSLPNTKRWRLYYKYLRQHPRLTEVWCVDSTDVDMLNQPVIEPGKIYIGWEPRLTNSDWMMKVHTSERVRSMLRQGRQLLNCGIIGGDYRTVLSFVHDMIIELDKESNESGDSLHDMGACNVVAYEKYADKLVTGTKVATVFKMEEKKGASWWKHK